MTEKSFSCDRATMQWSLFLLLLMGQCVFITCQLYEYHFIKEEMSWDEARAYCREKYTDLAKVFDLTDMRRLQDSAQNQTQAWIGLYSEPGRDNRRWHWSLPGEEYTENKTCWGDTEPNDGAYPENCVMTSMAWIDFPCTHTFQFICYNETMKNNKTFHLTETSVTWTQAQSYCRQHHTDLASGLDQIYSEEFKKLKNSTASWIGLFRDSWRWSDGSNFSFRYWDSFNDGLNNRTCATTLLGRSGRWSSAGCDQRKPFFCYDDKLILIRENKTWEKALNYCRQTHHDLVSISNPHQQRWVQERAKNASTPFVWLGLQYSCTLDLWFWVNDNLVCFDRWALGGKTEDCGMSAAMTTGGQWVSQRENETFNFICIKH
ncbi:putative C-type lectin domain family 20 member A [Astatotilapia calliptera]|uniref:C-type lectin domain-containing protein n=1 Tax=Astatotilapia calliptera TaxID=8154 RepID=A0A3P8P502_ASTCA|nr:putative C-type lectin domain family 20 member A [Astatotilapia calliptera]XP_026004320.1 putative C-type lectin domain family 20 member A [Astatotilapia calliptera]